MFLTSLSLRAKKPSACVLTETLARSGSGTLAFTWPVFWSARKTLFFVSKKIRAVPFKSEKQLLTLRCFSNGTRQKGRRARESGCTCTRHLVRLHLAIGSVDFVDHISQQNLLINSTAEFLVLGVFADLQVVSFEGLIHTVVSGKKRLIYCVHHRGR